LSTLATTNLTLRAGVATAQQAQQIVDSVKPYPSLHVLWLVEAADDSIVKAIEPIAQASLQTWGIELGNELDLGGLSSKQFGDWVLRNHTWLRAAGYTGRVVSGGIFAVQPETLKWLTDAGSTSWPVDIIIAIHRYGDPDSSDKYTSRDAENQAILQATRGHQVVVTEFGYPTHTSADEAWAAEAVKRDISWFGKLAAPLITQYQLLDGPGTGNIDHFGIKTVDGRWKPGAETLGIMPRPPPSTLSFDLVACKDAFVNNYCNGPAGSVFSIEVATEVWKTFNGDGNGYAWASGIPDITASRIRIQTPGYQDFEEHINPRGLSDTNAAGTHNHWDVVPIAPPHVDPTQFSLNDNAAIRGAMWTVRGPWPYGPRPGQADNITALEFIYSYGDPNQPFVLNETQRQMIATYKSHGYTHNAFGPPNAQSYHGQYPDTDFTTSPQAFDKWLDWVQMFWDVGLKPVVFLHPDGATLDQTKALLEPLIRANLAKSQHILRIVVPTGWEPTKYGWSSRTWGAYADWIRSLLPDALILIHTVSDVDAPVGTDALYDDNGHPNSEGWAYVSARIHGWLVQNSAFDCPTCVPNPDGLTNFQNFTNQFSKTVRGSYYDRFHNGYAGWPTSSLWGNGPIRIYAGEFCSYWEYWNNRPYEECTAWGDAAVNVGADGYLDSGTVPVSTH
jgi:hypothetical protein